MDKKKKKKKSGKISYNVDDHTNRGNIGNLRESRARNTFKFEYISYVPQLSFETLNGPIRMKLNSIHPKTANNLLPVGSGPIPKYHYNEEAKSSHLFHHSCPSPMIS